VKRTGAVDPDSATHLYQELHDATTQREEYDPQTELAQIMLIDKTSSPGSGPALA